MVAELVLIDLVFSISILMTTYFTTHAVLISVAQLIVLSKYADADYDMKIMLGLVESIKRNKSLIKALFFSVIAVIFKTI